MRRAARSLIGAMVVVAAPGAAQAAMWCAQPIDAHEWGVQVFSGGASKRLTSNEFPIFLHTQPDAKPGPVGAPVRGLPPDTGIRLLPVLQFFAGPNESAVPVGVEVGFAQGDASAWFPQVDRRVPAAQANSAAALAARGELVKARLARPALDMAPTPLLPPDPTKQLAWDALTLSPRLSEHPPAADKTPWVARLRKIPALWVGRGAESERFVFYEARTTERPQLQLEPGPTKVAGKHHLTLRNVSVFPVHDVFLVHREGERLQIFMAPTIPAGATAGLLLEDHPGTAAGARAALRKLLVEAPAPKGELRKDPECTMQRDPAVPVEAAEGHTLREDEADTLLEVWGARFFDADGTTLVYREDTKSLDAAMPLAIFTDMLHHVRLHRAGLGLVEGLTLPE